MSDYQGMTPDEIRQAELAKIDSGEIAFEHGWCHKHCGRAAVEQYAGKMWCHPCATKGWRQ